MTLGPTGVRMVTLGELARLTGFSRQYLWKLAREGRIPHSLRVGGRRIYIVPLTGEVLRQLQRRRPR